MCPSSISQTSPGSTCFTRQEGLLKGAGVYYLQEDSHMRLENAQAPTKSVWGQIIGIFFKAA